jgi:hypothetical protein
MCFPGQQNFKLYHKLYNNILFQVFLKRSSTVELCRSKIMKTYLSATSHSSSHVPTYVYLLKKQQIVHILPSIMTHYTGDPDVI